MYARRSRSRISTNPCNFESSLIRRVAHEAGWLSAEEDRGRTQLLVTGSLEDHCTEEAHRLKAEGLLHEGRKFVGINSKGDIGANLIVAAYNTTSFIARETCLRSRHDLEHFVVRMKETSEPTSKIEGRLSLHQDEVPLGVLQEYNEGTSSAIT
jgi:hypothetical protein